MPIAFTPGNGYVPKERRKRNLIIKNAGASPASFYSVMLTAISFTPPSAATLTFEARFSAI